MTFYTFSRFLNSIFIFFHKSRCKITDGQDENIECTPWSVDYESATGIGFYSGSQTPDIEAIRSECESNNPGTDNCPSRACQVEGYFVVSAFIMFVNGYVIDVSKQHENGFDNGICGGNRIATQTVTDGESVLGVAGSDSGEVIFDNEETVTATAGPVVLKECCGRYPIRFPYNAVRKSCCGVGIYDPIFLVCCDDGVARVSCDFENSIS